CADRSRTEEPVGDVDPPAVSRQTLVRPPDAPAGSADPYRALLGCTVRCNCERGDTPRRDVLAAVPVQKRRISGLRRAKQNPRRRGIPAVANAPPLDRAKGGLRASDMVRGNLVTSVQLVILVSPGRRAFAR